jgi:hypothetical protein
LKKQKQPFYKTAFYRLYYSNLFKGAVFVGYNALKAVLPQKLKRLIKIKGQRIF